MLIDTFGYAVCLEDSVTNTWTVDDCFGGRQFDFDRWFLPERIAGVRGISCLGTDERRSLNQIRERRTAISSRWSRSSSSRSSSPKRRGRGAR